mmetsp:Transcript_5147/g.14495  ORF Transcript_5147/g.14495 Transcript_5147/m.14495 type:complete len:224 (-) Transcript_5147:280-951(-)|eukprot:CAMPEP_0168736214 /NCGR_PEP_ID=MMETSP0724-20121128/9746_1 /TAXON_ID=265536 /ORGANISM="Amphiprora sp., Strain CCMP467" /LENGTH=223 /DNA_ID=CAMNT_0008783407 /DNA_START=132 /DNA_END=803 /DNA_ORIENTATION=-
MMMLPCARRVVLNAICLHSYSTGFLLRSMTTTTSTIAAVQTNNQPSQWFPSVPTAWGRPLALRQASSSSPPPPPPPPSSLLLDNDEDYRTRAAQFGLAAPSDIEAALADEATVVLDVRTAAEISQSGQLERAAHWYTTPCTPQECPALETDPSTVLPPEMVRPIAGESTTTTTTTTTTTPTIVIYCGTGKRARRAKAILEAQGYQNVLNAGSLADVQAIVGQK